MSGTIKAKTPDCNNWDTPVTVDLLQGPKTTRSKEPVIPTADLVKLYQHIVSGKDDLAKGLKSIANDLGMTEAEVVLQTFFMWPRWNDWNDRDGGRRKSNWGTLLHLAVRYDKQDIIAYLCGPSIFPDQSNPSRALFLNATEETGETALTNAIKHNPCRWEVANQLIQLGANVNASDPRGWTALHFAARLSLPNIMQKLIENGADINAATEAGDTAMHLAVLTGKVDLVKKLLGMGPKPDLYAVNRRGNTPLDTAWLWGFAAVGKLLGEEMEADGGEQKARERKNVEEEKKKAEGVDKMMGNSKKSRDGAGLWGEEEWTSLSIADAGPNA